MYTGSSNAIITKSDNRYCPRAASGKSGLTNKEIGIWKFEIGIENWNLELD